MGLQWSNVDAVAKVIRLEPGTTKNDEGREVPYGVLPELEALLEDQRAYTDRIQRHLGAYHTVGVPLPRQTPE